MQLLLCKTRDLMKKKKEQAESNKTKADFPKFSKGFPNKKSFQDSEKYFLSVIG